MIHTSRLIFNRVGQPHLFLMNTLSGWNYWNPLNVYCDIGSMREISKFKTVKSENITIIMLSPLTLRSQLQI